MNSRLLLSLVLLSAGCSTSDPEAPDVGSLDAQSVMDAALDAARDAGAAADAAGPEDAGVLPDAAQAGPDAAAPGADASTCLAASDAGAGSSGHAYDGWHWKKTGRVAGLPEPAKALDGNLGPALVVAGDTLHLYFTKKEGLQHRIHHATSTDGASWTAPVLVEGLGNGSVVGLPSVHWTGERFRMWYGSGSIDLAESVDGATWTVVKTGTLMRGASGDFDSYSVLYPSAAVEASGVTLFFTGYDGADYAIGRAVSNDGLAFTRSPKAAVLVRGPAGALDNRAVAQPCVVRTGGRYRMWYGAYDTSKTNPGPYRVALAESDDGVAFEKRGLTLELAATGDDAYSTRDPAVVRWRGQWLMVYSGMGDDSRYRLLTATSDACP